MLPEDSPTQAADPATLPPVQPLGNSSAIPLPLTAPTAPLPTSGQSTAEAIAQAKQLLQQYQGNPYRLNAALQQLKADYLTSQYHINTNSQQT